MSEREYMTDGGCDVREVSNVDLGIMSARAWDTPNVRDLRVIRAEMARRQAALDARREALAVSLSEEAAGLRCGGPECSANHLNGDIESNGERGPLRAFSCRVCGYAWDRADALAKLERLGMVERPVLGGV